MRPVGGWFFFTSGSVIRIRSASGTSFALTMLDGLGMFDLAPQRAMPGSWHSLRAGRAITTTPKAKAVKARRLNMEGPCKEEGNNHTACRQAGQILERSNLMTSKVCARCGTPLSV